MWLLDVYMLSSTYLAMQAQHLFFCNGDACGCGGGDDMYDGGDVCVCGMK